MYVKTPNKKLTRTHFVHFVISLKSRFYTLTPISVFCVDIFSSRLRLFKIDLAVSLRPATNRQYFILVLSLPLLWLRVAFVLNTVDCVKNAIFQASDIAKRISI